MRWTIPLVLNPRSSWLDASTFPLPVTVDCTTPRPTVTTRRPTAADGEVGPTIRIAVTTAPMQRAPSAYTSQDALVRLVICFCIDPPSGL